MEQSACSESYSIGKQAKPSLVKRDELLAYFVEEVGGVWIFERPPITSSATKTSRFGKSV